jgi:dihydroneopterin aldolase
MVSRSINSSQKDVVDQEMVLEENEANIQDTLSDSNAYEICILLCKNIVKCFKK